MIVGIGDGGWALFWSGLGSDDPVLVRVRFSAREGGRLQATELHLESQHAGGPRLTLDTLRDIPLGAMEAWANGEGRNELIEAIEDARAKKVERAMDRALIAVGGGEREPTVKLDLTKIRRNLAQLRIPDPPRPDSFYEKVGEVYSALAASGSRRPAQDIADANGIPRVTTVHRWIREARDRGLLPDGQPGKAG